MVLHYGQILQKLMSNNDVEILDALSRIGGETVKAPPSEVVNAALGLLQHPDPDIRQEVVFALGLHWTIPDAKAPIVKLLRTETEERVLAACVRSIGCYGEMAGGDLVSDKRTLADIVVDERYTDHVRGLAYVNLLHLAGRLEHRDMATVSEELIHHDVDWLWVRYLSG